MMINSNGSTTTTRINREETCPSLIRLLWTMGRPPRAMDFNEYPSKGRGMEIRGKERELYLYTWPDATLREICDFIQESVEEARSPSARLGFELVHIDPHSNRARLQRIGIIAAYNEIKMKTIAELGYRPGDALSVCIFSAKK